MPIDVTTMPAGGSAPPTGRAGLAGTVLAIDLGATHVRAALVGPDGAVGARVRERTLIDPAEDGGARLVRLIGTLDHREAARAVIGVPGRVDYAAGTLDQANNLPPHWPASLNEEDLSRRLGLPVSLASDADLAAVGEAYHGAGRGAADVAYLTISSGVGAGGVSRGRLLAGTRKLVEIGNFVVDAAAMTRGEPCTVDELGSGRTLERWVAEAGLDVAGAEVPALARAGDPRAAAVWRAVVDVAAVAAVNVLHAYAPDVLVVGGAVGRADPSVLEAISDLAAAHGPRHRGRLPAIRPAALDDDSALAGAGAWTAATAP